MDKNAPSPGEEKEVTLSERIILGNRESQEGIAASLRRAFEAQIPVPRTTDEFEQLLARIH